MNDKIKEKLLKLQAMAEDTSCTDAERETAMRLLNKIAEDYCITLADIQKKPKEEIIAFDSTFECIERSDSYRKIANAVCDYLDCVCVGYSRVGKDNIPVYCYKFVGPQSQAEYCDWLVTYLLSYIRKTTCSPITKRLMANKYHDYKAGVELGFQQKVTDKIKILIGNKAQFIQNNNPEALVFISGQADAIKRWMDANMQLHYATQQRENGKERYIKEGSRIGDGVNINRVVGGKTSEGRMLT